jgi:hypothetical protein
LDAPTVDFFNDKLGLIVALPPDWVEVAQAGEAVMYVARTLPQYNPNLFIQRLQVQNAYAEPDMHRQLADTTYSQRAGQNLQRLSTVPTQVAGQPATDDLFSWHDPEIDREVVQRQIFVQVANTNVMYILTCTFYQESAERFHPIFDRAIASLQLPGVVPTEPIRLSPIPLFTTLFPSLNLSLSAPVGWKVGSSPDFQLLMVAPVESGYQANAGFNKYARPQATPGLMDNLIQQSHVEMSQNIEDYRQVRIEQLKVNEQPARLRVYERKHSPSGLYLSQMQFLYLPSPDILFLATGSSLQELAHRYLPVFEEIFRSAKAS